jgi:hypothetical protein
MTAQVRVLLILAGTAPVVGAGIYHLTHGNYRLASLVFAGAIIFGISALRIWKSRRWSGPQVTPRLPKARHSLADAVFHDDPARRTRGRRS